MVTVAVNQYEEKNTTVCGEASVLLPVLPILNRISAQKTASVAGKKIQLTNCLC